MAPTRRAFGSAVGTAFLAGCLGGALGSGTRSDSDGDGSPDVHDEYPNDPDRRLKMGEIADLVSVAPGRYTYWDVELTGDSTFDYEFTVLEGPAIDFYTMSAGAFERFERGRAVEFREEATELAAVGGSGRAHLPVGNYVVVLDNTGRGRATPSADPDGPADVRFTVAVYR